MTEHECPYGSEYCPKVLALEDEVHDIEEEVKHDLSSMHDELRNISKTLYIMAGILTLHLGVVFL